MSELSPLIGGPLALDLINTRTADADLLATPRQLHTWLTLQDPPLTCAYDDHDLASVRALRDRLARVLAHVRAGTEPAPADLAALNDTQRAAAPVTELTWNGTAVTGSSRRSGTPIAVLLAWLASSAADLIVDPDVAKIKECEADDCVLLFLPANPRRRWCSPERCGNRVRVARHYQRHKP